MIREDGSGAWAVLFSSLGVGRPSSITESCTIGVWNGHHGLCSWLGPWGKLVRPASRFVIFSITSGHCSTQFIVIIIILQRLDITLHFFDDLALLESVVR